MELFRQWAFSVCAAAVAGGMAHMLLPKSNLAKIFSLTLSAFFLCSLLSPLLLNRGQLRFEIQDYGGYSAQDTASRLEEIAQAHMLEQARGTVIKLAEGALTEAGLPFKKIDAIVNMDEENSISFTEVIITLEQESAQEERIREVLERRLGLAVKLVYPDAVKTMEE